MGGRDFEGGVPDPAGDAMDAADDAKKDLEEAGGRQFNHFIAYPLAFFGAIFFGVGNFILALIGYEEGIKTFYP